MCPARPPAAIPRPAAGPPAPRRSPRSIDRLDGLDDPADRHELAGQPRGERGVLADRRALPIAPADVVRDGRFPGRAAGLGRLRSRAIAGEPGIAKTRTPGPEAGITTDVSLPSHRAIRSRHVGPSGDSRASKSAPSSTTPAAPAATAPAATRSPTPPRTQTGKSALRQGRLEQDERAVRSTSARRPHVRRRSIPSPRRRARAAPRSGTSPPPAPAAPNRRRPGPHPRIPSIPYPRNRPVSTGLPYPPTRARPSHSSSITRRDTRIP